MCHSRIIRISHNGLRAIGFSPNGASMNDLEYRRAEHEKLLNRWLLKYAHLENDHCEFTNDGPSDNWASYWMQHPRILFLLKEAQGEWWQPQHGFFMSNAPFAINVALWSYAIKTLYHNPGTQLPFPNPQFIKPGPHDLAFVEVKKLNHGNGTSKYGEIKKYAKQDKELLKEQIELIAPDVVLCANTIDFYDIIYDEIYSPYETLSEIGNCHCYRLDNRLVIDFYHPSQRRRSPENLFSLLSSLMLPGKVFETFNWLKKYRQGDERRFEPRPAPFTHPISAS